MTIYYEKKIHSFFRNTMTPYLPMAKKIGELFATKTETFN